MIRIAILLAVVLATGACKDEQVVEKTDDGEAPSKRSSPPPKAKDEPGPGAPETLKGSVRLKRLRGLQAPAMFGDNGPKPHVPVEGHVNRYMEAVLGDGRVVRTGATRCPMSKDEACLIVVACTPGDCEETKFETKFEANFYVGDRGEHRLVVGSIIRDKGAEPVVVRSAADIDELYADSK